jgi:hypothetical protein
MNPPKSFNKLPKEQEQSSWARLVEAGHQCNDSPKPTFKQRLKAFFCDRRADIPYWDLWQWQRYHEEQAKKELERQARGRVGRVVHAVLDFELGGPPGEMEGCTVGNFLAVFVGIAALIFVGNWLVEVTGIPSWVFLVVLVVVAVVTTAILLKRSKK